MSRINIRMAFSYDALPDGVAAEMRKAAGRIRQHTRAAFVEVGRELLAAKARVEHGRFQAWVKAECQISPRTAARAMQVAELVDKNDKLSFLPPDGLLALASLSSPEDAVTEILQRIEAGETPTAADIKREIQAAKVQRDSTPACGQRAQSADRDESAEELSHARAEKTEVHAVHSLEGERDQERTAEAVAALTRVATMLIDAFGDRIAELVPDLEIITTAALAQALHLRRPDLFDDVDHQERPSGPSPGSALLADHGSAEASAPIEAAQQAAGPPAASEQPDEGEPTAAEPVEQADQQSTSSTPPTTVQQEPEECELTATAKIKESEQVGAASPGLPALEPDTASDDGLSVDRNTIARQARRTACATGRGDLPPPSRYVRVPCL